MSPSQSLQSVKNVSMTGKSWFKLIFCSLEHLKNPQPGKTNLCPHTQWLWQKYILIEHCDKDAIPWFICLAQRKRKPAQSAKINTGCKRDVSSLRWAVGRCKMQSGYIVRKTWGTKGYMSFQQSFPQEKDVWENSSFKNILEKMNHQFYKS